MSTSRHHSRKAVGAGVVSARAAEAADADDTADALRPDHLAGRAGEAEAVLLDVVGEGVRAREAVIAAITTEAPATPTSGPAAAAVALHALLPLTGTLTAGERALLAELLDRISAAPEAGA